MADYSVPSPNELFAMQFWREAGKLRVAVPGVIRSFDAATQTASVQPALKMKINLGDGVRHLPMPVIDTVPVVLPFAQTAGLLLTLPIQPGDECLVVFADKAIDHFVESGGLQAAETSASEDTTTQRGHHLTDAICIPGIISNPQAVPEYSTTHIEMRDRERKHFISMGPDGITISDSTATWKMAEGKVTLDAPMGIDYRTAQNMDIHSRNMDLSDSNRIYGCLISETGTFIDKKGVSLGTHTHPGDSGGTTGTPNPGSAGLDAYAASSGSVETLAASVSATFGATGMTGEPYPGSADMDACALGTYGLEEDFDKALAALKPNNLDKMDRFMLCLPDIAENMAASVMTDPNDIKGWLYLRSLFHKWFSGPANLKGMENLDPFWIDWDWVISYTRVAVAYNFLIGDLTYTPDWPVEPATRLFNHKAREQLGVILKDKKHHEATERKPFNFIATDWQQWKPLYHQHATVTHMPSDDGVGAALGGLTLRALTAGYTEPLGNGRFRIHVTSVAVYAHDLFNFSDEDPGLLWSILRFFSFLWSPLESQGYGWWNCETKTMGFYSIGSTWLTNKDFNNFRNKHGKGNDFQILSRPHLVEGFRGVSYDYP